MPHLQISRRRIFFIALVFASGHAAPLSAESASKKKKMTLEEIFKSASKPSKRPSAVVGVRGLDETTDPVDAKARDFDAVERIEAFTLRPEDVDAFRHEGNLK